MVASRAARERKATTEAGPLATVKIDLDAQRGFAYKIGCTSCTTKAGTKPGVKADAKGGRAWSTYRAGADNGYMAAMDRWIFHLHQQHVGAEAPCLAYLPEAEQRLHERRTEHGDA